ncbi:MAG: hypothetical protein FWD47_12340 [Treponema sp.]|nr:hypothetical protein [Treponema sp.]
MFPTGDYDRFYYDVLERYDNIDTPITFGVLIADYNQGLARDYIVNYLDIFDKNSDKYIDFFIPGYVPYEHYGKDICKPIHFRNKQGEKYYFSREAFHRFITEFKNQFDIEYPYSPILVLMELSKDNFTTPKKIIIELDSDNMNIKRSGILFDKIFEIAKQNKNINGFETGLVKTYLKGEWLETIVRAIDNSVLTEMFNQQQNIRSFKCINP